MTTTEFPSRGPANLIGDQAIPIPGDGIVSVNPADPSRVVWSGTPDEGHVERAVDAARAAQPEWARLPIDERARVLRRFQDLCKEHAAEIASLICDETGKALWDCQAEAALLPGKVDITLDDSTNSGLSRVTGFEVPITDSRIGRCSFRPHGVMAVVGPFNFPAHLPNGHIVPALLMGNTIVFKPSDKTPAVGQMLGALYRRALRDCDHPAGVVNVVQGAAGPAKALVAHPGIDGILFTGSWPVGRRILEANLDRPSRIVALEMGGNNPAVVLPDADLRQAAIEVVRAAFITTGQRCTCTRRLIVHRDAADRLLPAIVKAASTLIIGDPRADHPVFMGPIATAAARDGVQRFQQSAIEQGARPMLESTAIDGPAVGGRAGGWYVSPGILQVERFTPDESSDAGCDIEVFGPLLRVAIVDSLDDAIAQANATRYGLASSIFTRDRDAIERFTFESRAGCINVNTGTAGASSKLPFGGLGLSGNHRPAGAFSLDYCAYPVAGLIETGDAAPLPTGMAFDDDWIA